MTKEAVIVTEGKNGCYYICKESSGSIPTHRITTVDEGIGAGDFHVGAFIGALARGYSLEEACLLGNDITVNIIERLSLTNAKTENTRN